MSNWFEEGKVEIQQRISEELNIDLDSVQRIYDELVSYGFIDYDVEKEVIRDYVEDEECSEDN